MLNVPNNTKHVILGKRCKIHNLGYNNTINKATTTTTTTTTTVLRPFVWDYPGEPVPGKTFTHTHLS